MWIHSDPSPDPKHCSLDEMARMELMLMANCPVAGPDEQDAGGAGQERRQTEGSPCPQAEEAVRVTGQ